MRQESNRSLTMLASLRSSHKLILTLSFFVRSSSSFLLQLLPCRIPSATTCHCLVKLRRFVSVKNLKTNYFRFRRDFVFVLLHLFQVSKKNITRLLCFFIETLVACSHLLRETCSPLSHCLLLRTDWSVF